MSFITNKIRRALLQIDFFPRVLGEFGTYRDKVDVRGPRYRRPILFSQEGSNRIEELIVGDKPFMVTRLGAVELSCIRFYLENRRVKNRPYPRTIRFSMFNNAGFFPADNTSLDVFSDMFLDHIKSADVMGIWFNYYEDVLCNTYCGNADLVDLSCLEPFRYSNPWSSKLFGKKVLVVHPFIDTIQKQYRENRHLLFAAPDVLPVFELKTVRAVQSIASSKVDFNSWFDAYRYMCDEIGRVDFEICLIGAGAYGLPLASFVKSLGKKAIHMGGVTQILFGIKGKRWEEEYANSTAKLFNEHWIRPLESETPKNKDSVEKGCYW